MNDKKQFLKGIAVGIIITLAISSATNVITKINGHFNETAMNPTKKINEIVRILNSFYVDDFEKSNIEEGMYWGLVAGIGDPYTSYMDKTAFNIFKEDTEGTYAGIGVVVSKSEDGKIMVVSPYEGAPGQKAGILPGDKIVKVNGFDVSANQLDEAVSMMKGPAGTSVSLTLFREIENKTFKVDITRANINIPTVSHKMITDDIGYLKISQFDRVTFGQFIEAYEDLQNKDQKAMIIDLRNNPGGLLDTVVKIAKVLANGGTIVYTEYKDGQRDYHNDDDERHIDIPVIVLTNGGSASASEILAGAIKDLGLGKLVGTTTFGKGLVQNIYPLPDSSAVKVTIARYYTPSGVCIQGTGIEPDIIVELSDDLSNKFYLTEEEDLQLQKAIEVLEEEIDFE